jgi:uncharacterized damage-inducible protein DinB
MMRTGTLPALALTLAFAAPAPLASQAVPSGVRGDIRVQFDAAAEKLIQLAEAIPVENYGWRPAEGVRSVSEVLMHVAGGNYLFSRFVGSPLAAPFGRDAETTVTDKARVVQHLKQSVEQTRSVIGGIPDGDLEKATSFFGNEMTYRGVLMALVSHEHEHLGQMIAYARSNGVTPPWSSPE